MATRIRNVWDTDNIAHMWAHATQLSARNPQGNFSFAGDELRSYATTIAKRVSHKGTVAFLCLDSTWSSTTARHQSMMRRAAFGEHVYQVTVFPASGAHANPAVTRAHHKMNVEYMLNRAAEYRAKAGLARSNRDWLNSTAHQWREDAVRYAGLFGVRSVIPSLDDIAGTLAKISAQAKRRAKKEREARERKAAEREAYRAQFYPALIAQWRKTGQTQFTAGEDDNRFTFYLQDVRTFSGTDLMRLNGDNVETSMGATVPAPIVRLMARKLLATMGTAEGNAYVGRHVGPYAISEVTADAIRVGCHFFTRDEIRLIADTLERAEIVPAESTAV